VIATHLCDNALTAGVMKKGSLCISLCLIDTVLIGRLCVFLQRELWLRHMNPTNSWCKFCGCFSPEVLETAAQNLLVWLSPEQWSPATDQLCFIVSSSVHLKHFSLLLCEDTHVNKALHVHVNMSLTVSSGHLRQHHPGSPCNEWLDHLRDDSNHSIGDLWRRVVCCGHCDATTWWPSPVKWWWNWWWRWWQLGRWWNQITKYNY